MRITVSHNKGRQEAMRVVGGAVDQILRPDFPGPLKMSSVQKSWSGSTMTFSLTAGVGFLTVPINGSIIVTDTEITIDCDLPALLTKFLPESAVRTDIESKVRGLLK